MTAKEKQNNEDENLSGDIARSKREISDNENQLRSIIKSISEQQLKAVL